MPEGRYGHSVELKMMGVPYTPGSPLPTVYRAMGCRECSNTGYHGRVAIQQVMGVDTQMEDLIGAWRHVAGNRAGGQVERHDIAS